MPRQARGRYVEDPEIRSMRVRSWYRAVILASKLTAAELEEEFSERVRGRSNSPHSCIWDKYRRGETEPRSGRRSNGRHNLVERVERRYPGTAKWLTSPIWRLADKAQMQMDEIRGVYEGLPQDIRSILIASPEQGTGIFWRRPLDHERDYAHLVSRPDIHRLIAVLAIVKEAGITQSQHHHFFGVFIARQFLDFLARSGAIDATVCSELTAYLNAQWNVAGYFDLDVANAESET